MVKALKKNYKLKIVLLLFYVFVCLVRLPNFEKTVWSSSDTNYQCLMNVSAMQQTDRLTGKILPLITYSDGTDCGLSYSSGAFDRATNSFFYYVSFPTFPFITAKLFFDIFSLPVGPWGLYILCNILFGISLWVTISMFQYIFEDEISDTLLVLISGITFAFSTEIMHSLGLTYWGQNWYMLFFPLLVISALEYIRYNKKKDAILLALLCFVIMQTEWTGYFACAAVFLILLLQKKENRNNKLILALVVEAILSIAIYLLPNIYVVGTETLFDTLAFRAEGRMRNIEYSIFDRWDALIQSFGCLVFLCAFFAIWYVCVKKKTGHIGQTMKQNKITLFLLSFPIIENFILSNHAMTYSMDRMKIYYVLCAFLFFEIEEMLDNQAFRNLIVILIPCVMFLNLIVYRFVDNSYLWEDNRLEDSVVLAEYIKNEYSDCAIGQLGTDSVWGYSKLLFDKGIAKCSSTDSIDVRAKALEKRYSVALNGINLANTQYWYTSAIIHDLSNDDYKIIGTIPRQYAKEFDDYVFLKYSSDISLYVDGFSNKLSDIDMNDFENQKDLEMHLNNIYCEVEEENVVYYIADAKWIPKVFKIANISQNEWVNGVDYNGNRLIVERNDSNENMIRDSKVLVVDEEEFNIEDIDMDENYMFITLEQNSKKILKQLEYPNNIEIR